MILVYTLQKTHFFLYLLLSLGQITYQVASFNPFEKYESRQIIPAGIPPINGVTPGSPNRWDQYHIITQLAIYTTYIPGIVLANWVIIWYLPLPPIIQEPGNGYLNPANNYSNLKSKRDMPKVQQVCVSPFPSRFTLSEPWRRLNVGGDPGGHCLGLGIGSLPGCPVTTRMTSHLSFL